MQTILIVHPYEIVCEGIALHYRNRFQVIISHNAKEMRAALHQHEIAAVLLSLQFPEEGDGLYLLEELAKQAHKVIVLSTGGVDYGTRLCFRYGAYAFLDRQRNFHDLDDALDKVLQGHRVLSGEMMNEVMSEMHTSVPNLNSKQVEILNCLFAVPMPNNDEIALTLKVSPGRIKNILTQTFVKFGVKSRHALLHEARRVGYFPNMHPSRMAAKPRKPRAAA